MERVCGIVLAAGAGTRFGGPKALARGAQGTPWLERVVAALRAGGCAEVVVVLGAGADAAAALVPDGARVVIAERWAEGLSRSLIAGLTAAACPAAISGPAATEPASPAGTATTGPDAAVIVPVDVPGLPSSAVSRVLDAASPHLRTALVRAAYNGAPGHPVLIGAAHWPELVRTVTGDTGAGPYLRRHDARAVECGDLWSGLDLDTPPGHTSG